MMLIALIVLVNASGNAKDTHATNTDNKKVQEAPTTTKKQYHHNAHQTGQSSGGNDQSNHPPSYPTYTNVWGEIAPDHNEASLRLMRARFGNN